MVKFLLYCLLSHLPDFDERYSSHWHLWSCFYTDFQLILLYPYIARLYFYSWKKMNYIVKKSTRRHLSGFPNHFPTNLIMLERNLYLLGFQQNQLILHIL